MQTLAEEDAWGLSPLPRLLLFGHVFPVTTGVRWGGGRDRVSLAGWLVTVRTPLSGKAAAGPGLCSWGSCWCPLRLSGWIPAVVLEGSEGSPRGRGSSNEEVCGPPSVWWEEAPLHDQTLRKTHWPNGFHALKQTLHQRLAWAHRLLAWGCWGQKGVSPQRTGLCEDLCMWESAEGWGGRERGDRPTEPQLWCGLTKVAFHHHRGWVWGVAPQHCRASSAERGESYVKVPFPSQHRSKKRGAKKRGTAFSASHSLGQLDFAKPTRPAPILRCKCWVKGDVLKV